jgi:hypothetical protein
MLVAGPVVLALALPTLALAAPAHPVSITITDAVVSRIGNGELRPGFALAGRLVAGLPFSGS